MPLGQADISNSIQDEGSEIILTLDRVSPTSATLTWVVPKSKRAYNGILITASLEEINPSNYPINRVKYTASTVFSTPADRIGSAVVVGAFYNDKTTTSVTITGLDPNDVYFCSAHLITNVNTYYGIGVRSYATEVVTDIFAPDLPRGYEPPLNPAEGQAYYDENQKMIFTWLNGEWTPSTTHTTLTGPVDPEADPSIADGTFFYNTRTKLLKIWSGTEWVVQGDTATKIPTYNKAGAGTDLSFDERANLVNVLKKQLGWPVVCVELTEDQFHIAIDNALMEFRRRSDQAYYQQYLFLTMQPYQNIYYLNDPMIGTYKIVDVLKVHRLNMLGYGTFGGSGVDPVYAQSFLNQLYAPGIGYDLVSIHLTHSLSKMHSLLFAGDIAFNWREASRELTLHRLVGRQEKVLIECSIEKTEQELLLDRWSQQWIQQWALSEAMEILARIRGKFTSLPGPGGSLTLNADALMADAKEFQTDCLRQISDFEVGSNGPGGFLNTSFVIG
jgi:hypothetical protein